MSEIQPIIHHGRLVAVIVAGQAIISDTLPKQQHAIVKAMCLYALEIASPAPTATRTRSRTPTRPLRRATKPSRSATDPPLRCFEFVANRDKAPAPRGDRLAADAGRTATRSSQRRPPAGAVAVSGRGATRLRLRHAHASSTRVSASTRAAGDRPGGSGWSGARAGLGAADVRVPARRDACPRLRSYSARSGSGIGSPSQNACASNPRVCGRLPL